MASSIPRRKRCKFLQKVAEVFGGGGVVSFLRPELKRDKVTQNSDKDRVDFAWEIIHSLIEDLGRKVAIAYVTRQQPNSLRRMRTKEG